MSEIVVNLKTNEVLKLKGIVKELYESNSIDSDNIEEFLKFTVFIVFEEYDKNNQSIKQFYKNNLKKYLINKD